MHNEYRKILTHLGNGDELQSTKASSVTAQEKRLKKLVEDWLTG